LRLNGLDQALRRVCVRIRCEWGVAELSLSWFLFANWLRHCDWLGRFFRPEPVPLERERHSLGWTSGQGRRRI